MDSPPVSAHARLTIDTLNPKPLNPKPARHPLSWVCGRVERQRDHSKFGWAAKLAGACLTFVA